MSKLHFTTKHANEATVQRNWYVVDGTNQTVGRICSKIAAVLRGKTKRIIRLTLIAVISSS
jgi:large subunit ribosomal protein L13